MVPRPIADWNDWYQMMGRGKKAPGMIQCAVVFLGLLCGVLSGYSDDTCQAGRTVIVHLFNWKWTDIAAECERFLGPKGFCGVQISPPNEHPIITEPFRPWYERYQLVSFILKSRSGTRKAFTDMVQRCNAVGVRIYVDAVINHLVPNGDEGKGTAGSYYNAKHGALSFPAIPFGPDDVNGCQCGSHSCCSGTCGVDDYGNVDQVRNCRLLSLLDLKLSSDYVRQKIADYLNDLISIGVSGFRVDACKHMWPKDLQLVYDRVSNLNTTAGFPPHTRPFIYCEVIDLGSESISGNEYVHLGRITEFRYSMQLGYVFRKEHQQKLTYLKNFGEGWGFMHSEDALVFVDNHDNQRGHGAGGESILTFKDSKLYKLATAFTMAWPYGFSRIISSYDWTENWTGPPNTGHEINDVQINSDGSCGGGWICEHRWGQITNMVVFRNVVSGARLENWWDNGNDQIAFARGNMGFLAINNDGHDMNENLQTGLAQGTYCDVISGDLSGRVCTGTSVKVDRDGKANIIINSSMEDPMVAIHACSRVGSDCSKSSAVTRLETGPSSWFKRTVVLVYFISKPGEDVFFRGGMDSRRRPSCSVTSRDCFIRIKNNKLGEGSHYDKHNAWRAADTLLDWEGVETGQGEYQRTAAEGSPAAWTTNSPGRTGYQVLNTYGEHYWMMDVDMDCSQTEGGWFEVKSYVMNGIGWEGDRKQNAICEGDVGGSKPYTSSNHFARCGYVNVFSFNSNRCEINEF